MSQGAAGALASTIGSADVVLLARARSLGGGSELSEEDFGGANPETMGDFLVAQFYGGERFQISDVEFSNFAEGLDSSIAGPAMTWMIMYLAYLMRFIAKTTYGDEFDKRMMMRAYGLLMNAPAGSGDFATLATGIKFWFTKFDEQFALPPKSVEGRVVPTEVFVAMNLLILDPGSPYHMNKHALQGAGYVEFDVAEALLKAKERALPFITRVISHGGRSDLSR